MGPDKVVVFQMVVHTNLLKGLVDYINEEEEMAMMEISDKDSQEAFGDFHSILEAVDLLKLHNKSKPPRFMSGSAHILRKLGVDLPEDITDYDHIEAWRESGDDVWLYRVIKKSTKKYPVTSKQWFIPTWLKDLFTIFNGKRRG